MNSAALKILVNGHVLIKDAKTGEVLLDRPNAIHNQNMATAIARGLSHSDFSLATGNHQIYALALGNGGATVDSMDVISFLPPNIIGTGARLYNQTFFGVVDPGAQSQNSVTYQSNPDTSSIVIITMTINANEPAGQDASDSPPDSNFNSQFAFNELGLYTFGTNGSFTFTGAPADSLLLTHIIFSPILKTANRELVITYTLTTSVS